MLLTILISSFVFQTTAMPIEKRNTNKKNVAEVIAPFAVKLFKNISSHEDTEGNVEPNFIFSPLAVTRALAMLRDTTPGPARYVICSLYIFVIHNLTHLLGNNWEHLLG